MISPNLFAGMVKFSPTVYIDSNIALDKRFADEIYPALREYNRISPVDERIIITVLPSCVNQLKNRMNENRLGYDPEIAERAKWALDLFREDSDKGDNFIYCEEPRKSIFTVELFTRLCKDKLNKHVYVLTNNAKLRRDLARFDLADSYVKSNSLGRYSSHNHMVRSIGYKMDGEFAVIKPIVEEADCVNKPDIYMTREIDFGMLADMNAEVFIDCNFIANKSFAQFDKLLTDYNANATKRLKVKVTTPTTLEINRLAFDESVNNSEYARMGMEIIGKSFSRPWEGNYERVEGDGIDFFFDACFLSKCCALLTKKPVAILTHDKGLTRDCNIFSKMESFRCEEIITYDYDTLGDVRISEVGRFNELMLG